jgi:chaperone protein EcpD
MPHPSPGRRRTTQRPRGLALRALLALALLSACWPSARAALVLGATRLIYRGGSGGARIDVRNVGRQPALMQAWIDAGNPEARPQDIQVPFVVTPPMVRIDPGRRQSLGVVFTGPALPSDRESLYWLNVLDIPPRPDLRPGADYIQFAVRTRIKLIYRPAGLHGGPARAMRDLRWREQCREGRCVLSARNPTPYVIPIVRLRFPGLGTAFAPPLQGTVRPFGVRSWVLPRVARVARARYDVINDFGAFIHADTPVTLRP